MRSSTLLTLGLFTLAATACHHKKHQKGPPAFEAMCAMACERTSACDPQVDVEECRLNCIGSLGPIGPHLREEYVEEIEQCVSDARCIDLGSSALDNSCRREASDRIGANLKVVKLCDGLSATLARCTVGEPATRREACLDSMKVFDDDTIEDALGCNDTECAELGKCFTTVIGFSPAPATVEASSMRR